MTILHNENDKSAGTLYAINTITSAIKRFKQTESPAISYEKLKYSDLIHQMPRLIEQGKIFIGFTGGLEAFESTTLSKLLQRSHYKVSDIQWSDNWITLDCFLHHIFKLKGYFKTYDDGGE